MEQPSGMDFQLNDVEARILGCLVEKSMATPEYYPLSLNALVNACNQKSSRDPVVSYDEQTVAAGAQGLIEKGLVWKSEAGRVDKYEERFSRDRNLVPREASVICVLLLRGPQTAGEIRGNTARLHFFDGLEAVDEALSDLQESGYVRRLPRAPGRKEPRYAHLLGGDPEPEPGESIPGSGLHADAAQGPSGRVDALERELTQLRAELEELKSAFEHFKEQFQ